MTLGAPFPEILAAAQQGAQWAWSRIYQDLAGPVTGYLTGRGGAEPDDLVSETFLQVARGIHGFAGDEDQFRSWVFVIAHRRLLYERRKSGRRPATVPLEGSDDQDGVSAAQTHAGGDVEAEAMDALGGEHVRAMLEGLTPDQRDVVMLRIVGGLSLEEAARVLGKPVGAVKALQHRAVKALQRNLSESA
jgi:RNA polymerase sigma-70 factor (ECF subfamily)